jgi:hypothetical protein
MRNWLAPPSGTPTPAGTFTVGVTVNDGESSPQAWSAGYTLVISPAQLPADAQPPG